MRAPSSLARSSTSNRGRSAPRINPALEPHSAGAEICTSQTRSRMSKRFTGKVCLVTGGARNIGFATVKAFLDEGASVAIIDRNPEALEKATSLLLQRDPTISDRLFTAACD